MRIRLGQIGLRAIIILALVAPLLAAYPVQAYAGYPLQPADPEVAGALDYLRGQQAADGSISDFATSSWAVMAIAAAGEDPHAWSAGGASIVDYLAANAASAATLNDRSRMVLAVVAASRDPSDFGGVDLVAQVEAAYDGVQMGDPSLLNDDFWGLMALAAAGRSRSSAIVAGVRSFILANQNPDGGWSWGVGQGSDVDDAAAAIMALIAAGEPAGSTAIQNALACIKSTQMEGGGFDSWGSTNSATDSWGIMSLAAAGQVPTSVSWRSGNGTDPVDDLLTFRNPDGSFNWQPATPSNMALMTAFAVPALLGSPYPVRALVPESAASVGVRIEGRDATIWSGDVAVIDSQISDDLGGFHYLADPTALGALDEASRAAGFDYVIQDMGWGLYLYSVNGEEPEGWTGWMYRVDYSSPMVGCADFVLGQTAPPGPPHSDVLFYWGDWEQPPLRIEVNDESVFVNEWFTATVSRYDDGNQTWVACEGATVHTGADYVTGPDGMAAISVARPGICEVYAEKEGFIRSEKLGVVASTIPLPPPPPPATGTPTPSPTPSPTPAPSATATPPPTQAPTPTPTIVPTATASPTPTATPQPTPSAVSSPQPTASPAPTPTPESGAGMPWSVVGGIIGAALVVGLAGFWVVRRR